MASKRNFKARGSPIFAEEHKNCRWEVVYIGKLSNNLSILFGLVSPQLFLKQHYNLVKCSPTSYWSGPSECQTYFLGSRCHLVKCWSKHETAKKRSAQYWTFYFNSRLHKTEVNTKLADEWVYKEITRFCSKKQSNNKLVFAVRWKSGVFQVRRGNTFMEIVCERAERVAHALTITIFRNYGLNASVSQGQKLDGSWFFCQHHFKCALWSCLDDPNENS